jgi:hypothetical protein
MPKRQPPRPCPTQLPSSGNATNPKTAPDPLISKPALSKVKATASLTDVDPANVVNTTRVRQKSKKLREAGGLKDSHPNLVSAPSAPKFTKQQRDHADDDSDGSGGNAASEYINNGNSSGEESFYAGEDGAVHIGGSTVGWDSQVDPFDFSSYHGRKKHGRLKSHYKVS